MNRFELAGWCLNEVHIESVYRMAKEHLPSFPTNGCATTLSLILSESGIEEPDFGVYLNTKGFLSVLPDAWKRIPNIAQPEPGDIFVTIDANNNNMPDHLGLVLAPIIPGYFWACDNKKKKYVRNTHLQGNGRTPVEYWLRKVEQ